MALPPVRRVILLIVAIVVAVTCIRLGFWQLSRLHGRRQVNARIAASFAQPPQPLQALLADADPASLGYRRAEIRGTYDPAHEVILFGRASAEGRSGNQVLTPLVMSDGTTILVNRGWVPPQDVTTPVAGEAAAPTGPVDVSGILFPPDATTPAAPGASPSTLITIVNLEQLSAQMPHPLLPVYLLLQQQQPAQPGPLPEPPPMPILDDGPHLSYALQWFSFATIAVVGYVVLLRKDRKDERRAVSTPAGGED
ncbi:MAG: SURF1 family cytochrome oxidase biogenesis protein [Actinomycetota bacterium]